MYEQNYTDLIKLWQSTNPNEYFSDHNYLLSETRNLEIIKCTNGWIYDKSVFASTVITDVIFKIQFLSLSYKSRLIAIYRLASMYDCID
jgi:hypothetical protein